MFCHTPTRLATAAAILIMASLGCSKSEDITPEKLTSVDSLSVSDKPAVTSKDDSKASKTEPNNEKAKAEQIAKNYTAPYPNRVNPFQPPTNAPRLRSDNKRDRNSSVTLVGFANVDEPKVVLAIDGVVSPMSNGEEIAGVQVISIAPPNAVLQRGRNRWTASLTN